MSIKKTDKGWQVDCRPNGRNGKRVRKSFTTKAEASRYESFIMGQAAQGKDWNPSQDKRKLSELINLWYHTHGQTLKDGKRRFTALLRISESLGDPSGQNLKGTDYLTYRSHRLSEGLSGKTANNELTYLNAVFNELARSNAISFSNPLAHVRPVSIKQTELTYLTHGQINELLTELKHDDANLIARICLSTGCRWGEAEGLYKRHVSNGLITFTDTKSGKNRSVPISKALEDEILARPHGQLFGFSLSAFRRALARTTIELPKGQASHVLRHTFASHFMLNGGSIITLQNILGHSTITMTMRYAHLSPEHLKDALTLNPLAALV
ncbi:MAG: phage integrase [Pontibacterium sp.]